MPEIDAEEANLRRCLFGVQAYRLRDVGTLLGGGFGWPAPGMSYSPPNWEAGHWAADPALYFRSPSPDAVRLPQQHLPPIGPFSPEASIAVDWRPISKASAWAVLKRSAQSAPTAFRQPISPSSYMLYLKSY